MAYGTFPHRGIFAVHKLKPNGQKGQRISGHESKTEADKEAERLAGSESKLYGGEQRVH